MNEYIRLADRINEVFGLELAPHDGTKAFVKLFSKMLSRKESVIAAALNADLRSAGDIAFLLQIPEISAAKALKRMARKGIIYEHKEGAQYFYKLMPFVPGIFEALVHEVRDSEIAEYLKEYTEEISALNRRKQEIVIPLNSHIEVKTESVSYEEICLYLDRYDRYAVMDCMCRTIHASQGNACGHTIKDMCLLIGEGVEYYVRTGKARPVLREEIERILIKAEAEGLVHEMYPMNNADSIFICNCCSCGCLFLELSRRIHSVISYDTNVAVDSSKCSKCGICIERCPGNVFTWGSGVSVIKIDSILALKGGNSLEDDQFSTQKISVKQYNSYNLYRYCARI